jgi:nicotinamide mononucleotide adenylyltransferase
MGGVAGHMSHLYDNPSLSFTKMREIMAAVSNGEIEAEEKVDGQNLFISYSEKDQKAKAARNLGNLRSGGLSAESLSEKFFGRGNLYDSFTKGFEAFEAAVNGLNPETRVQIFGPDADIWYNAEIMDPGSANVILYDNETIKIHDVGHFRFNKKTGKKSEEDVSTNLAILDANLSAMQNASADKTFSLIRKAMISMKALEDDKVLTQAYSRLDTALRDANISNDDVVGNYVYNRILDGIDTDLNDAFKNEIVMYLLKIPGNIGLRRLKKGLKPAELEDLMDIVSSKRSILSQAIEPIERIVHDFSVEILKNLESAFIIDNGKEASRLRSELSTAVEELTSTASEDPESMEIMQKHLNKIGDINKITTPVEGIVFSYEGNVYKFTGNYAPLNQILGLFKYGRGTKQLATEGIHSQSRVVTESPKRRVALFPGKFRPPHRGHFDFAKKVANRNDVDELVILISPVDRQNITAEQSVSIWNEYLKSDNIPNITVEVSEHRSPVAAVYEFAADSSKASTGDTVVLIKSTKDTGDTRFSGVQSYAARHNPGVSVETVVEEPVQSSAGKVFNARDMRRAIANGDAQLFKSYLPPKSDKDAIWNMVYQGNDPTELSSFIEGQLDEMSAMAGGAVEGSGGGFGVGGVNTYNPYERRAPVKPKKPRKKPQVTRAKGQRRR